jgi:CRISPR/Cas system-associated protein Cas7 (RAMP superfamily)
MADSKNPPVLPEGYDPELDKANKGYNALEKEKLMKQRELDAQDQRAKDKAKALMDFGANLLKPKKGDKEPVKKAMGGKVSSASKRADGCAIRGKTKA